MPKSLESHFAAIRKQIEQLDKIKSVVTDLPDEKDGLDIRQYKRQALMSADQLRNHLTAVFKLAS